MRFASLFALVLLGSISCDAPLADLAPDAGGAALDVSWDPRVCGREPRGRIEIRLVDGAGTIVTGDVACGACALVVAVPHVGWYQASAVTLDDERGSRALAAELLAIDGPAVRWRIRAW